MLQDLIKERLAFLEPTHLNLKDLSDLHKGHKGNTGAVISIWKLLVRIF
jgi:stress-induced morphogen